MINIEAKVHTSTTITSLKRANQLATVYGEIKVDELYLLSTIYDLLNTMCLSLSNNQRKQLISAYNKLAFKSKNICTGVMLDAFKQPMKNRVSSVFVDPDCIDKNEDISYWKAEPAADYESVIDMLSRDYISKKPKATREAFESGYLVSVPNIGKYVLFINTSNNLNITIKDALDNDVTSAFDFGYIPSLNGVLIVSKLIYTSTPMSLKIIQNDTD